MVSRHDSLCNCEIFANLPKAFVSSYVGVMHPCHIVMRSVQHRGHGYIRPLHPPVRGLGLQHVQYPHGHDANNRGQRRRPLRLHQAGWGTILRSTRDLFGISSMIKIIIHLNLDLPYLEFQCLHDWWSMLSQVCSEPPSPSEQCWLISRPLCLVQVITSV